MESPSAIRSGSRFANKASCRNVYTDKGSGMLELRPNCEYCDRDLPPTAKDARICSYECTFCTECVETILHDVCPNCGGGFVPRPIRPATERRPGVSLAHQPASTARVHLRYGRDDVASFVERVKDIAAGHR